MLLRYFGFYSIFPFLDIPLHLIGGAAIANTFILIFKSWENKSLISIKDKPIYVLLIVSIVALFATLWEFWEFVMTQITNSVWQGNLQDTMKDFSLGLIGGLIVAIFRKYPNKNYKTNL
jgi:hypothetical protein